MCRASTAGPFSEASRRAMGKAIDTFAPCGPALVLLDEIPDLQALGLRARVNGQTLQDASASLMIFAVAEAIAHVTRVMTPEPGGIIASCTPAGVGMARDPQVWLPDDEVVEVEIDGIGTLRNPMRC
jgi:2-keto-4-pentenoate hydratase/2-oxohepta-3-ene-1,7-dioic acid hydratase in catechol pathway